MVHNKGERIVKTKELCTACGGKIVIRMVYTTIRAMPRYGNPEDWDWVRDSKYCKRCKTKYD